MTLKCLKNKEKPGRNLSRVISISLNRKSGCKHSQNISKLLLSALTLMMR